MYKATTVLAVHDGKQVAMAGDGQVTMGETVVKHGAKKIRRLYHNRVLAGFAGAVADAFTLFPSSKVNWKPMTGNYSGRRSKRRKNGEPTGACVSWKPCCWWLIRKISLYSVVPVK